MDKDELKRRAKSVSEEHSGLIPFHKDFYFLSLLYSVDRGLAAFRRSEIAQVTNRNDATFIFAAVQEGISHAASASRFLWPIHSSRLGNEGKALHLARGKRLRELLSIEDTNILNNRALRDTIEHYDERLDLFLLEQNAGHFFPEPMLNSHELADDPVGKIFKLIDLNANCIVLFNEKFFLDPIISELSTLKSKIRLQII